MSLLSKYFLFCYSKSVLEISTANAVPQGVRENFAQAAQDLEQDRRVVGVGMFLPTGTREK